MHTKAHFLFGGEGGKKVPHALKLKIGITKRMILKL